MLLIYGFKGFLGALLVTLTCTNTGDLARVAWERVGHYLGTFYVRLHGE